MCCENKVADNQADMFSINNRYRDRRRKRYLDTKYNPANYCVLVLCSLVIIIGHIGGAVGTIMGDNCDWTGSGLTADGTDEWGNNQQTSRGVIPVYLRCTAGRVKWMYPRGALRVLLRMPHGRDFRACVKQTGAPDTVTLFLEGPRSLHKLYPDKETKAVRCFQSKKGQAALYVETTDWRGIEKRVVEIEYDLQPLPKNGKTYYDPVEECRPCTGEEMAHAFCTSDLVTRGIIRGVENRDDLEVSQVSIKVTKMIRYTNTDSIFGADDGNSLFSNLVAEQPTRQIDVHVAQHCGVAHGEGEFVFMARRKLGDLRLQCAPRLEDWLHLARTLDEEGKARCILKS